MVPSTVKHGLHCFLLITLIVSALILSENNIVKDSVSMYDNPVRMFISLIRLLELLLLPVTIINFLGLVVFNAFPDKVSLKRSPLLAPFISFRVVTRGDYPNLVKATVTRNIKTCLKTGLEKFNFEVVTDQPINIPKDRLVREIVVPDEYNTKTGAKYKARALQYCLEDSVNILEPNDWIVHLDEETTLTDNSVKGIINFVTDGRYPFGQGFITYANDIIVNWFTTFADCLRVSLDGGLLRYTLKVFHKPIFSWKGSFMVAQLQAERDISFEVGLEGSISEDCFFALTAISTGYSFDWIEGEMYEKSPFTLLDLIKQRKRCFQGNILTVQSKRIPLQYRIPLMTSTSLAALAPFVAFINILPLLLSLPCPVSRVVSISRAFSGAVLVYMYLFGTLKSFSHLGLLRVIICMLAAVCLIPIFMVIENIATLYALVTKKQGFYIVQKEILATEILSKTD